MATDMIDSASHEAEKGPRAEDMTTIRKLVRKIDFRVLPWITITYALSLIDRTNIGTAKIAGMEKDLNLLGDRYNIALLIFFPAYIITEIPSNSIIRRIGTRKYLTFMIAGWGAIAMCFGFLQNYDQLVGMRFLLGLFEGGFAVSSRKSMVLYRRKLTRSLNSLPAFILSLLGISGTKFINDLPSGMLPGM